MHEVGGYTVGTSLFCNYRQVSDTDADFCSPTPCSSDQAQAQVDGMPSAFKMKVAASLFYNLISFEPAIATIRPWEWHIIILDLPSRPKKCCY